MRCPKCRSANVVSTQIFTKTAVGPGYWYNHGHPLVAAFVAAVKVVGFVNNSVREKWKCESCKQKFSPRDGACAQCTGTSATMFHTKCCQATLCEACATEYNQTAITTCPICTKLTEAGQRQKQIESERREQEARKLQAKLAIEREKDRPWRTFRNAARAIGVGICAIATVAVPWNMAGVSGFLLRVPAFFTLLWLTAHVADACSKAWEE